MHYLIQLMFKKIKKCIKYLFPCFVKKNFNSESGTELKNMNSFKIDIENEFIIVDISGNKEL